MTQPRVYHRIFFGFLLSTLSMALPEVITMNDPIPWIHPMGYVLGYPVYGLHILVLGGLMYKYSRIGIVTIMSYGGLFGLYEGYLIKQLWNPNWGAELTVQIGGVRVVHTLMLVFFVHPVLAFLVPLVIAELFLARPGRLSRALPFLRSRNGVFVSVIGLAVWLGLIIGSNLPKHGGRAAFAAPVISIVVVGGLAAIWLWMFKGNRFGISDLMPQGKGLWILAGLLVLEYVVYSRIFRPEAMPTEWLPHVIVIGIYAFFVTLIMLWGTPNKATDRLEENVVNASTAPWWLAVLGACIFLLIAFVHATAKQPGGVVAIISFLGGAVVNLSFLVVCFFVGWQRWLRRRSLPSERCS
ncbi:MAG: hypothetical protein ACYS1A_11695 [Planctomycetota bacterium]|jgi:hypothetical protein